MQNYDEFSESWAFGETNICSFSAFILTAEWVYSQHKNKNDRRSRPNDWERQRDQTAQRSALQF